MTFYSLRKGACSSAFKNGAPLPDVRISSARCGDSVLNHSQVTSARFSHWATSILKS